MSSVEAVSRLLAASVSAQAGGEWEDGEGGVGVDPVSRNEQFPRTRETRNIIEG